ncbi:MAG: dihydropteroate synthase, partial [Corynebacterium casei]|nr:dihydropteroate synthase [Corynebacterium casei]
MQVADICPDAAAKRTLVMGIVNVTEDSFSDGGKWIDIDRAIAHGRELVAQGADMIDVGGESTRPGATRVEPEMEKQRVAPVVQALAEEGIVVSVDTMRASVAEAAVEAGALLLNDVSGGLADDNMYSVMADSKVPVCLMHWRTV